MTHDSQCPARRDEYDACLCDLINDVRADEREKAAQRVESLLTNDPDWREGPPGWWDCTCMEYYFECAHRGIERAVAAARGEDAT